MTTPAWPEELLGAPEVVVPDIAWADVRVRTGLEFPADYKEFAALYPALIIDDVLLLRHPLGPPGFNLLEPMDACDLPADLGSPEEVLEFDPVTNETRSVEPPDPERLFPWGRSGTAPVFGFWNTHDDPSQWTVVLAGQFHQWHYRGPLTAFLPDILTSRVTCPLLPGDWPDPEAELEVQQLLG